MGRRPPRHAASWSEARSWPTSNKIYADLGYEPVVDMAEHLVRA